MLGVAFLECYVYTYAKGDVNVDAQIVGIIC